MKLEGAEAELKIYREIEDRFVVQVTENESAAECIELKQKLCK